MTDPAEFNEMELHWISQIVKAEKTLPDDFWATAAMQELACLLAVIEPFMSEERIKILIGIGALLLRLGRKELEAEIQTAMIFQKLKDAP